MADPRDDPTGHHTGPHSIVPYAPELKPIKGEARLGRYQLLGVLGQGGMAEVFLAQQDGPAGFKKTVVIKRILPQLATDTRFVEMFQREARVAASLNHTNIVQVFELGEEDGQPFIVMEHVVGSTLLRLARAFRSVGRSMPVELALAAVSDAALGLHYANTVVGADGAPLGLVHRDISPDNLIVNREAVTKILDFGIAKGSRGREATSSGDTKGKIPYMSPEQIRGEPLDGRSDLYSLGITLYWALTGKRPFRGKNEFELMERVLKERAPRPSSVHPRIPPAIDELILALIEKDPDKRPRSGDDVHAALVPFVPPRREIAPVLLDALTDNLERTPMPVPAPVALPDAPSDVTVDEGFDEVDDDDVVSLAAPSTSTGSDLWGRTATVAAPLAAAAARRRSRALAVAAGALALVVVVVIAVAVAWPSGPPSRVAAAPDDGAPAGAAGGAAHAAAAAATGTHARDDGPAGAAHDDAASDGDAPANDDGASGDDGDVAAQLALAPLTGDDEHKKKAQHARPVTLEVRAPAHIAWIVGGRVVARGIGSITLPPGKHAVLARDTTRDVDTLVPVTGRRIDYQKLPRGTLDVRVFPTAQIWAGRDRLGEAPLKISVVAGRYKLRLKDGDVEATKVVEVAGGKVTPVRVRLR